MLYAPPFRRPLSPCIKQQGDSLVQSRHGVRGIMERLYDAEKNHEVRKLFKDYIRKFAE